MPNKDLKNIVVLKDLPSNIIDEAILILKKNKNAKKIQYQYTAENRNQQVEYEKTEGNEYIVKEAESVISNYITKIEGRRIIQRKTMENIEVKYKRIKVYSVCISIIAFICIVKGVLL